MSKDINLELFLKNKLNKEQREVKISKSKLKIGRIGAEIEIEDFNYITFTEFHKKKEKVNKEDPKKAYLEALMFVQNYIVTPDLNQQTTLEVLGAKSKREAVEMMLTEEEIVQILATQYAKYSSSEAVSNVQVGLNS